MTTPNPYAPPESAVADLQPRRDNKVQRTIVAVLVAIQFLATLRYANLYWQLVSTGSVAPLVLLLWVPGTLCLYVAAIRLMYSRKRGKRLFLCAAVGLGASVPFWSFSINLLTLVAVLGAGLGLAGWWVARSTAAQDTSAEPLLL